ncbi:unnamed protein product [Phyllotreta striolata]|uniref:Uncharacterized protein n=1 Tax=Phyllotreta striolata TaxID=444603 RepID=A0A9N9XQV3_PHYSR|nr:unnamed protein product [Phyllotreta striolata]
MFRISAVAILMSVALKDCISETKLKDVLWNSGKSNYNRSNNEDDENVLKSEVKNVLKLCSSKYKNDDNEGNNDDNRYHGNGQASETYRRITQNGNYYKNFGYYDYDNQQDKNSRNKHNSNNDNYNTRNDGNTNNDNNSNNNNNNGYRNRNNNYNSGSYGSSSNNNEDPYSSYGSSNSYSSNNRNNNNYDQQHNGMVTITCKCPPCSSYQSRFDSYSNSNDRSRNGNSYDNRGNGYGTRSAAGYNGESSNGYGSGYGTDRTRSAQQENSFGYNNRGRNDGYDGYYNVGMSYARRTKREKNNNEYGSNRDDFECTSQCVFGQMELLDDDQTPSETLVIKWIQDHIPNDDMKRIRSLREVRKCFTRMSTTSIDDNCDYSNELAKCLNLEFD